MAMNLDLNEVATHLGKHISCDINLPPIDDPDGGLSCVEPITGEATFTNTGSHIVVRGSAMTTIELECARCLDAYRLKLEIPIEEELPLPAQEPDATEEAEEEELAEEDREPLFVENILDIEELLRQDLLVAVPIKPVCSEGCKGLCPHCGRNLNAGPCKCPTDAEISAFAALASLLKQEDNKES